LAAFQEGLISMGELSVIKVCDDGIELLTFLTFPSPFFYLKARFGDWTLPPSSGKSLLKWAQSIELAPISERLFLSKRTVDNVQKVSSCTYQFVFRKPDASVASY
jgi:hypothetical protein